MEYEGIGPKEVIGFSPEAAQQIQNAVRAVMGNKPPAPGGKSPPQKVMQLAAYHRAGVEADKAKAWLTPGEVKIGEDIIAVPELSVTIASGTQSEPNRVVLKVTLPSTVELVAYTWANGLTGCGSYALEVAHAWLDGELAIVKRVWFGGNTELGGGSSLPTGGLQYQALVKNSGDDGDVKWDWIRAH